MAESDIPTAEIPMKQESLVNDAEPKSKPTVEQSPAATPGNISVVVIGATGVTGRYVVAELLLCPEIATVRVVTRRKYEVPREYANSVIVSNAAKEGKLVEHIVDLETVSGEELRDIFEGVYTFFNCLGSTRSKAGSKERFIQIDMEIPVRFAQTAREKGVKHTSLLTSSRANEKSVMFYYKVKGLIENAFRNLEFPALSIFRPGLLGRKEQMKFGEKMFSLFQFPLQTDDLARAMVHDSLNMIRGLDTPLNPLYTNPQIKALNTERLKELRSLNNPSLENPEYNEDDTGVVPPVVMDFSQERNEQGSINATKDNPIDSVTTGESNRSEKPVGDLIPTASNDVQILVENTNNDENVFIRENDLKKSVEAESIAVKPYIVEEDINTNVETITITAPQKVIEPIIPTPEPTRDTTEPISQTTEPITDTTEPISQTTEPITDTTEPISQATELITESTQPIVESTEPITKSTKPIIESIEPIIQSSEPTTDISEPTIEPTEPIPLPTASISETIEPIIQTPESNSETGKEKETDPPTNTNDSFFAPNKSIHSDPDLTPTPLSPDSTPALEQGISTSSDRLQPEDVTLPECDISKDLNFSAGDTDMTSPSTKPDTTNSSFQTANSSDISDPITPQPPDTNP